MKLNRLVALWIVGIGLWVGAKDPAHVAWACSGFPQGTLQSWMRDSTLVVYGIPVQRDDFGRNGLIYVIEYLKGTGPSHLLLNQITINEIARRKERIYQCSAPLSDELPTTPAFYFLVQNSDGSYKGVSWNILNIFPPQLPSDLTFSEEGMAIQVTVEDVYQISREVTGEERHLPDFNLPLPIGSPLLLRTENDSLYMIPVGTRIPRKIAENVGYVTTGQTGLVYIVGDRFEGYTYYPHESQVPISTGLQRQAVDLCTHMICADFSPYYDYFAYMLDAHTIVVCNEWRNCPNNYSSTTLHGESFAFSRSGKIAIWNADRLSIYGLRSQESVLIPLHIPDQQTYLNWGQENEYSHLAYHAAWSPDGRWLSFADAAGLWLWDTQSPSNEAVLVVANRSGELNIPSKFSQTGRYLHIMQNNVPFLFDTQDYSLLPNALLSYQDEYVIENEWFTSIADQVHWVNEWTLYSYSCYPGQPCLVRMSWFSPPNFFTGSDGYNPITDIALAYDYEPIWDSLAVVNTGTTITLNGAETLDLADYLDSPIVHIEWLPPIYYVE